MRLDYYGDDQMEKLGVEYVCTANGGRSPIAEAIGKEYASSNGISDRIKIFSSGSHFNALSTMDMPVSYLLSNLELGLQRGFYSTEQKRQAEGMLVDKKKTEEMFAKDHITKAALKTLASITEEILTREEEHMRDMALEEIGLRYDGHPKQYTSRSDVKLVLPMSDYNTKKVKELSDLSILQQVVKITDYAGFGFDIPNPFGKGIEAWRETRNAIAKCVKASLERAVGEYLL